VDPGPDKAQPVYYRSMIENALSLVLFGEICDVAQQPFRFISGLHVLFSSGGGTFRGPRRPLESRYHPQALLSNIA
jgi:hypothetical protein